MVALLVASLVELSDPDWEVTTAAWAEPFLIEVDVLKCFLLTFLAVVFFGRFANFKFLTDHDQVLVSNFVLLNKRVNAGVVPSSNFSQSVAGFNGVSTCAGSDSGET